MIVPMIVLMIVTVFMAVLMLIPGGEFAQMRLGQGQQRQRAGIRGKAGAGAVEPRRHFGSDPDQQIGLFKVLRLLRAQLEMMRIGPCGQQQPGLTQIAHDLLHERGGDRKVGHDARHLGQGRQGAAKRKTGQKDRAERGHGVLTCGNGNVIYVIS
jgi:hypothetical protein